jgi:hypothetical protein
MFYFGVPHILSDELLKVIGPLRYDIEMDPIRLIDSVKHADDLLDLLRLHEKVKASNDERVSDVHNWLRERGHFIVAEDVVKALDSADSLEARFQILDRLNQELTEWEESKRQNFT